MKSTLTFLVFILFNHALIAQNDTLSSAQSIDVEVYDVVAVYREHTDGRGRTKKFTTEMKGEIVKYDESTGVLTFKRNDGKMYSLTTDQYEYFQYDKEFTPRRRKNKQKVLKPRKDLGLEYSIGLNTGALNFPTGFEPDDNYVNGLEAGFEQVVCLKAGVSTYLNANSAVGLSAEYSLLSAESAYVSVGPRYQYIYNTAKNGAFYFPLALNFAHYKGDHFYQVDETVITSEGSFYPKELNAEVTLNSIELNIGQGVSFALKNKRSISLELMLVNQFIISEKVQIEYDPKPTTNYRGNGIKLSLSMNF
ncbi:MAG: hypothetical protein AB8B56_19945 [Crocinitomicaceae bacterium]